MLWLARSETMHMLDARRSWLLDQGFSVSTGRLDWGLRAALTCISMASYDTPPRRELVCHPGSDSIALNLGMLRGAQSTSCVFRSAICFPTSDQLSTRTLDSPLLLTERYRHRLSTTPVRGERAPSLFTVGCHILRILGHLKLASSRPFHLRNG